MLASSNQTHLASARLNIAFVQEVGMHVCACVHVCVCERGVGGKPKTG